MTPMRRRLSASLVAVLVVALELLLKPAVLTTRAELLYFQGGGRIQVPASIVEGEVRVEAGFGSFRFRESDFRKIVPGHDPEREWPGRRASATAGGSAALIDAAWWALENGLVAECVAALRDARSAAPLNAQAARLAGWADRLAPPCPDRDLGEIRRALDAPFDEARSPHVVLLHQHDAEEAKERLRLLEQVVVAYYLWFAFQGIDLTLPRERLVSVYFRDHVPYLKFLRSQSAGAYRNTLGYFHPTFRIIVAYDPRSSGGWRAGASSTDQEHGFPQRVLLSGADYRAHDHGTAAHELVHLLVAESGLAPTPDAFPHWLHEGLAAQFEVVRGGRWAGIHRANDLRLPHWRALTEPPRLPPLLRDEGFEQGYHDDLYAKSWALVYFLRGTRPREFIAWIDLLRNPDRLERVDEPDRSRRLLEKVFGNDLDSLQHEWTESMRAVRTPLEAHARLNSGGS
jgi:hypothetical protein